MLNQLYIKNFALIDELDITFDSGFSVITGETGAGKSIVLGAIGLLLGQRADIKAIKTGAQKCTIEAHFDLTNYGMEQWFDDNELDCDANDCILRRELMANGKSRAFINDTPASLHQMKELGEMLMDVHSQHQNLLLQKENFQLNIVDIIAQNTKERTEYRQAFNAYRDASKELELLKTKIAEAQTNEEFMRFQLEELTKAQLVEGEQEELELEADSVNHSEEIKNALYEAENILAGEQNDIVGNMKQALSRLQSISSIYPKVDDVAERMNSVFIEVKDIASEISSLAEDCDFNPKRQQYVNERLDLIYSLQRKFHVDSVAELIAERERLAEAVSTIDNSEEALHEQEVRVQELLTKANTKASKLTVTRSKASKIVKSEILKRLTSLGMPNVEFEVEIKDGELSVEGKDRVAFLFSANKGMPVRPVAQIASGGEIARVMLSLKAMVSGAVKLPTIIFDEIDTGVSGKMAEKMAAIMRDMGNNNRQVLSITHLPQIAAMGSAHYKVEKRDTKDGCTVSLMRRLSDEERVEEIAQMLSGSNITESAIQNAKELLGTL